MRGVLAVSMVLLSVTSQRLSVATSRHEDAVGSGSVAFSALCDAVRGPGLQPSASSGAVAPLRAPPPTQTRLQSSPCAADRSNRQAHQASQGQAASSRRGSEVAERRRRYSRSSAWAARLGTLLLYSVTSTHP